MGRKRVDTTLSPNPWQNPRILAVDAEIGGLIDDICSSIKGWPSLRVVRVATRCVQRVSGLEAITSETPESVSLAKEIKTEIDDALWLGFQAEQDASGVMATKVNMLAWAVRSEWQRYDSLFNQLAERSEDSLVALLEMGRVTVRLLETIEAHNRGDEKECQQKMASCAAHSIMAVTCLCAGDRVSIETAIRHDLKNDTASEGSLPLLWLSGKPTWSNGEKPKSRRWLSSVETRVNDYLMAKIKAQPNNPTIGRFDRTNLTEVKFPSRDANLSTVAIADLARAARVEVEEIQKTQLKIVQGLLDKLAGHSMGTYEANRDLALMVMKLVSHVGGVLLFNGEFVDNRGKTKAYTNHAVSIRCDDPRQSSFKLRTAGVPQTYVAQSTVWPRLWVVAKG